MKFAKFLKVFSVLLFIVSVIAILFIAHDMSTYGTVYSSGPWSTVYTTDMPKFIKISALSILVSAIICLFIFGFGEIIRLQNIKNDSDKQTNFHNKNSVQ